MEINRLHVEASQFNILPLMVAAVWSNDTALQLEATTQFRKLFSVERNQSIEEVKNSGVVRRLVQFFARGDCPQLRVQAILALNIIVSGICDMAKVMVDHSAAPILFRLFCCPSADFRDQDIRVPGNVAGDSPEAPDQASLSESTGESSYHFNRLQHVVNSQLNILPLMVAAAWSNDVALQLESTTLFRKLLCNERNQSIEVIKSGVVIRFVEFLERDDCPQLQIEAAWALRNIAFGTFDGVKVVINDTAVPKFIRLLTSPSNDVRDQAICALGNVAGDSPEARDLVLGYGALMPLLTQFNDQPKLSMIQNATWTLSNFCKGKPQPKFGQVKPALPALALLIHINDEQVLKDACWALAYLSDGVVNNKIQAVIEAGVCPRLVELLQHPSPSVLLPVLRTVGNIATGNDIQTQVIIDNKALPCLLILLTQSCDISIKEEACRIISNVTAGNSDQIQALIEAGIIAPLLTLLQNAEFEIKKNAAQAICNSICHGTHEQITFLVRKGCIKPLCDLLLFPDPQTVRFCLEGLDNILKVGEATKNVNIFAWMIDDAEGLKKIENLQSHNNNELSEKAVEILQSYRMKSLLI